MKPVHSSPAVSSFYHLPGPELPDCACAGLACFAARNSNPARWHAAAGAPAIHCLGKCYGSPSDTAHDFRPHIGIHARHSVLLGNAAAGGIRDLHAYRTRGGGAALALARTMAPAELVAMIDASALRGRGGAGFPAGRKWQALAAQDASEKFLVVNADEGDAGTFSDRYLLEDDPFCLIEAAIVAARALGLTAGYIYLRKEYPLAARIVADALAQARRAGWLGPRFDLQLVLGAGSYLCGEETALLNALEGKRPEARLRPPQVTQRGLFGMPTLVHNVETLCAVPWIVRHGAPAYAALGFSASRGTKLLSLTSGFQRPGLYEVEFGIPLSDIVDVLGRGLRHGRLKGLMVGGPLAGIVPPHLLSTRLGYEEMQAIACAVGHGGVIPFGDDTSIAAIAAEVLRFGASESCGKCTPCHLGAPQLSAMFDGAAGGQAQDGARSLRLADALADASLCGHGRGLGEFTRSLHMHFGEEWRACFT